MIPLATVISISKGDFIALNICLTTIGKCSYISNIREVTFCYDYSYVIQVTFCFDYFYVIPASEVGIGKHSVMPESTMDCSYHPD